MKGPVKNTGSAFKAWAKVNKRQLPYILGIAAAVFFTGVIIHLITLNGAPFKIVADEIVIFTDLLILPFAAVNGVYFTELWLARRIRSARKMIPFKLLATVLSVMLCSMLLEYIYASYGYMDDDYLFFGDFRVAASPTNVIEYTVGSFLIALPIFIWKLKIHELSRKLAEREMERERLIRLKTQAELQALQARINPHFLFNAFNSVASLISVDPEGAEKMMVQLSELFRYSLNSGESNLIPLSEEIRIVEIYLSIEKVRFGENLNYDICLSPSLESALIPRFIIQPLVENAIKHAMVRVKKGKIKVEISNTNGTIDLRLYDNGPAFPDAIPAGYGLQSTYDKLQLLYPGKHEIEFINAPEKHVKICFSYKSPHEQQA